MAQPRPEPEDHAKIRFQVELEFVQCLANPNYLNFLAQREYFKDPAFVNYIKYLQYWKEPEYAKFLKYPMCLYFLDLLQYPEFRKELANSRCSKFIEDQQLLHWQNYIRKRCKLGQPGSAGGVAGPGTSGSSGVPGSGEQMQMGSGSGGGSGTSMQLAPVTGTGAQVTPNSSSSSGSISNNTGNMITNNINK